MNQHTLAAFEDEFIKIGKVRVLERLRGLFTRARPQPAGWSAGGAELRTTRGLRGIEAGETLAKKAPQSSIQKQIMSQEASVAKQTASTAGKADAEIMAAIKSGKLDPKMHSIDKFRSTGEVAAKPIRAPVTPTPSAGEVTKIEPGGVPPSLFAKLRGRYRALPERTRQVLGGGALTTAGLGGGVGIGQAVN